MMIYKRALQYFKCRRVWIVFIYCLANAPILLISGQWVDDWVLWPQDKISILNMYKEAGGVPWGYIPVIWLMKEPNWVYRFFVFFCYLVTVVAFHEALRGMFFLSKDDAFWIASIATTVPVNDARVTLICFPYAVSLAVFMIAFLLATKLKCTSGRKYIVLYITSLVGLLYSYTTQSLLVFTGLIWCYLFYQVYRDNYGSKAVDSVFVFLRKYWPYLIVPFVFFVFKNHFLKPYGRYKDYNSVTFSSLIHGSLLAPVATVKTFMRIIALYFVQLEKFFSIGVIILIVIGYLFGYKCKFSFCKGEDKNRTRLYYLFLLCVGILVFFAGAFPYIIIRQDALLTTGFGGRDSLLIGFGFSIIAVSLSHMLANGGFGDLIMVVMIILGIFHFNSWYLNYQEDWYHQQEFANTIIENEGFGDDNTILCVFSDESPIETSRFFYSLTGMYYHLTGKQDKLYLDGIRDLYIKEMMASYRYGYNCDDYDDSDMTIDGILIINNSPIDNREILKIRYDEICNHDKYEDDIRSITDYSYVKIEKDVSDQIYEMYKNGDLNMDILYDMVTTGRQGDLMQLGEKGI